jgi:hypothetical protein
MGEWFFEKKCTKKIGNIKYILGKKGKVKGFCGIKNKLWAQR